MNKSITSIIISILLSLSILGCKEPEPGQTDDSEPTKTYRIGSPYKENGIKGIVFRVWDDGKHGLIFSIEDVKAAEYPWATINENTGAVNENNGKINTQTIQELENWETLYPAFKYWTDKGWYIPSIGELREITEAVTEAGILVLFDNYLPKNKHYYSSTEITDEKVHIVHFIDRGEYEFYQTGKQTLDTNLYFCGVREF